MKNLFPLCILACLLASSCKHDVDFEALNKQASQEYLTTIRCGADGKGPFWNQFAPKFIYAPAFDFEEVEDAGSYRFTLDYIDSLWRNPVHIRHGMDVSSMDETLASFEPAIRTWTFDADSPKASLAKVWNDIPAGYVQLKVDALDRSGAVMKTVGARKFLRDFPFEGPYLPALRPYREAAVMACMFNHSIPAISNWSTGTEPDFSYKHNGYPAKIVGATVGMEALMGQLLPEYKEVCITTARNAADWLISISEPEGTPLAFFPPTYWEDYIASGFALNKGTTMMMEAAGTAKSYLDLFDLCGDKKYYDAALAIAQTYTRLQRENGSFPIKVYVTTGEPVSEGSCTPTSILNLWRRLGSQYGASGFEPYMSKAEAYMMDVAIPAFDMTGQFEDVFVTNLHAFQNLTNATYARYAEYLLTKTEVSDRELAAAKEMLMLAEDQFVHWNALPRKEMFRPIPTPCVCEQYQYQTPVNASSANVAGGLIALYKVTGDRLALEKARALMDAVMLMQNQANGQLFTTWNWRSAKDNVYYGINGYWVNCTLSSIEAWLALDDLD